MNGTILCKNDIEDKDNIGIYVSIHDIGYVKLVNKYDIELNKE
jgi:hypothetical protein